MYVKRGTQTSIDRGFLSNLHKSEPLDLDIPFTPRKWR
jgi:hypothetical protein